MNARKISLRVKSHPHWRRQKVAVDFLSLVLAMIRVLYSRGDAENGARYENAGLEKWERRTIRQLTICWSSNCQRRSAEG